MSGGMSGGGGSQQAYMKGGPGQTLVNAVVAGVADGATVYTVTAGKTFYCLGAVIGNAAGAAKNMLILSDGTNKIAVTVPAVSATTVSGGGTVIFTCAATKNVTVSGAGGADNRATIWGWEE